MTSIDPCDYYVALRLVKGCECILGTVASCIVIRALHGDECKADLAGL